MKKGFTLIELLVVVLIIGILVAIAVPQYQRAVTKSRLADFTVQVKAIENAIKMYRLEAGSDPVTPDDIEALAGFTRKNGLSCFGKRCFYFVKSETNGYLWTTLKIPGAREWRCEVKFTSGIRSFCHLWNKKNETLAKSFGWVKTVKGDCSDTDSLSCRYFPFSE